MKGPCRYARAVGLLYRSGGDRAPTVQAKGEALMADEIVRIARRFGIPVVERTDLARTLAAIELDQEIPEELFEPVAVILDQLDMGQGKKK